MDNYSEDILSISCSEDKFLFIDLHICKLEFYEKPPFETIIVTISDKGNSYYYKPEVLNNKWVYVTD